MITLVLLVFGVLSARAQVPYNFQIPAAIPIPAPLTTLTMDCLAANGYGQWTTSSATNNSHLLANTLTTSVNDGVQAGILSSTAFNYAPGDGYPTSNEIKAVANLHGNVRYVWLQRHADPASDVFYVEGFDPGNPGVDISFSTRSTDASWPTTTYGLNDIDAITSTPDITLDNSVNLRDINNNYWGVGSYTLCGGITSYGTYLTIDSGSAPFICSRGLLAHKKKVIPQSTLDVPDTDCGYLLGRGYEWASDVGNLSSQIAAYDTLRLFLEHCPFYGDTGGSNPSWVAFNFIGGPASAWVTNGYGSWNDYLSFLKEVLYSNPDTMWYCSDVGDMLQAIRTNADAQAVLQYIVQNKRCPEFDSEWALQFQGAYGARRIAWIDSAKQRYAYLTYPPTNSGYKAFNDSVKADTLAHPFDSTIPTLYDIDMQILMGPQYAVTQPNTPITSQALLNASILDNPMKDEIDVSITMGREALVTMELRDILGRSIPITHARYQLMQQGTHKAYLPAPNLPPGTYYLRISTDVGDVITLTVVKE